MIRDCRLTAECRLVKTVPFEVDTVYFGEVVHVWVDDDVAPGGKLDWSMVDPLLFTFPDKGYWRLGQWVAEAWKVGRAYAPK
jgi:flavin reductase (DIM6/NTAB) family NADH-FMN oxidoreductase RutF